MQGERRKKHFIRLGQWLFYGIFLGAAAWFGACAAGGLQPAVAAAQKVMAGVPLATEERVGNPGWWPTQGTPARDAYAGPESCAPCHAAKAASQPLTPMARAARPAADADLLRTHERLAFRSGSYVYEIARTPGGSLYSVRDGVASMAAPLAWAFGAGETGQTYVFEERGTFHESRVSFYPALQALDLTLGHRPPAPGAMPGAMGRSMAASETRRCFGCHTTASSAGNKFDPSHLIPGVTCEACHGPGARHVAAMRRGTGGPGSKFILNPARLGPVDLVDFCGACHRTSWDVVLANTTGIETLRFQPYRLEKSKCWGQGEARLTCAACHDPHKPLAREAAFYDRRCLGCHVTAQAPKASGHRGAACPVGAKNCVTCHMPKLEIPGAHAQFTDHLIRVARTNAPYPD